MPRISDRLSQYAGAFPLQIYTLYLYISTSAGKKTLPKATSAIPI